MAPSTPPQVVEPVEWVDLLVSIPPGTWRVVRGAFFENEKIRYLFHPELKLHCDNEHCGSRTFFEAFIAPKAPPEQKLFFLPYVCRNCMSSEKVYALIVLPHKDDPNLHVAMKMGEVPGYGDPIPPRLNRIIGPDRDNFLNGYRCEKQGLGIGAFAYYRRVVENSKNRFLDEIIAVIKQDVESMSQSLVKQLEDAKRETQFSRAVDSIKEALPESVRIHGENPLLLLHRVASIGIHNLTDEECLDLASFAREVLFEFALRITEARRNSAKLKTAVSRLMAVRHKPEDEPTS